MLKAAAASVLLLLAAAADAAPPTRVHYTVAVVDPAQRRLRVTVRAEGVTDPSVTFSLPSWSPGWYVLQEPERHVSEVIAQAPGGRSLEVSRAGDRSWKVDSDGARSVSLVYELEASDRGLGFFFPYLDAKGGFVPGPTALAYVDGATRVPCAIRYDVPDTWKVASANDPVEGDPHAFTAPDYDTLADHPAELGDLARIDRTVAGVPVSVVARGADEKAIRPLAERLFKLVEAAVTVFGGAPFPRYQFQLHLSNTSGVFFGGLEHLNGCVVRMDSAAVGATPRLSDVRLCAHELTHAWIVKRIRPQKLGPFDYSRPAPVKDLWLCEGVTDYYAPRLMVEAGLANQTYWLDYLSDNLNQLHANPARLRVSLEESSLRVWETGYSSGYGGLSYYNKGMLVGWLLDIELRRRTQNRAGLDDLIKDLLKQAKESGRGFADGAIEKSASRLAGIDLDAFFALALRSMRELPVEELCAEAGIDPQISLVQQPHVGVDWDFSDAPGGAARVARVEPESAAAQAGLKPGDLVLDIDTLGQLRLTVGMPLTLRVLRDSESLRLPLTIGARADRRFKLRARPGRTPEQAAILDRMSGVPK